MSSNSVPRVFVVDDEPVIASTLAAILKLHGYSATSFTSPLEAIAAARSTVPDLLISDVAMPGISGVDLAIQMRAQYPACKILLFSGQATTVDLLEDARSRGHDFQLLEKPVHPSKMLSKIGAVTAECETGSMPALNRFRGVNESIRTAFFSSKSEPPAPPWTAFQCNR